MIRPATPADSTAVTALAVSSGLFSADDASVVDRMMSDYFSRTLAQGHVCLIDEEEEPLGVAYAVPVTATEGTWELLMIAVQGGRQGQGRGGVLLRRVEDNLRADGGRLLLVQTSGTPDFARTRAFYARQGYEQEARVRDYYAPGTDMILFRKELGAS